MGEAGHSDGRVVRDARGRDRAAVRDPADRAERGRVRAGPVDGRPVTAPTAVVALSLLERILLRCVLKAPQIATFVGVTGAGTVAVGYLVDAVLA